MRTLIALSALAALATSSACRNKESAPTPTAAASSDILARYHFVGTAALDNNPNAAKLKEIQRLPESRKLREQTLQKLARAPKIFRGDKLSAEQNERGAALLRPLLDDLVRFESFLQVRGAAIHQAEWTFVAQLPPERQKAWSAAVSELTRLWNLGAPTTTTLEGFAMSEVKRSASPNLLRWVEAGQWFVLGIGQDALPAVAEAARQIKAGGRPIPALTNWLETELNLPRLRAALELPDTIKWPHAKLTIVGDGENVRSKMQMIFTEPVTGPLEPWQVPTNIINEPLISFTAARGMAPWLKNWPLLQRLEFTPAPNELFFWAQAHVTFQSFFAFPLKDAPAKLERVAQHASSLFSTNWQNHGLSQPEWETNTHQLSWRLPFAVPFLKPAAFKGRDYLFGGLFTPSPLTSPPPAELISQLNNQSKLVCYDWEITQARLASWRVHYQFYAMNSGRSQLSTNNAALPWLMAIEPRLGNSATEIAAISPAEWSLVRKSHIGFTGVELVALALWLESANFPKLSLELPPAPPAKTASTPLAAPANTPANKPPGN